MSEPEQVEQRSFFLSDLLIQQPTLVVTVSYLIISAMGMSFSVAYLAWEGVNFLGYAELSDFLLAAFREPLSVLVFFGSLMFIWLSVILGRWGAKYDYDFTEAQIRRLEEKHGENSWRFWLYGLPRDPSRRARYRKITTSTEHFGGERGRFAGYLFLFLVTWLSALFLASVLRSLEGDDERWLLVERDTAPGMEVCPLVLGREVYQTSRYLFLRVDSSRLVTILPIESVKRIKVPGDHSSSPRLLMRDEEIPAACEGLVEAVEAEMIRERSR